MYVSIYLCAESSDAVKDKFPPWLLLWTSGFDTTWSPCLSKSQAPTQLLSGTCLHAGRHIPWYCNTPMLSVLYKDVPELQKSDLDFGHIPVCSCSVSGM